MQKNQDRRKNALKGIPQETPWALPKHILVALGFLFETFLTHFCFHLAPFWLHLAPFGALLAPFLLLLVHFWFLNRPLGAKFAQQSFFGIPMDAN